MAMAKVCLHTMARVDRPALACLWPTLRGQSVVLDVGASLGANASHLVDLAIMGAAMARVMLGLERPTVGLLNVGAEEIKGIEEVKAASTMLRDLNLPGFDYRGFVEGDGIGKGVVDVVVTPDGFTGNIALKTAEGTAAQIAAYLKQAMGGTLLAKLGYVLALGAFRELRAKMDTRATNGGVFLGLEGIVIKSHGGADSVGFARAIEIGHEMAGGDLLNRIRDTVALAHRLRETRRRRSDQSAPGNRSVTTSMPQLRSVVLGVGAYLPEKTLTNDELAKLVDTSDEWIVQRTGIKERHIAAEGETTSMLGEKAARAALADAGLNADDIDLIIVGTSTPDWTFPSTATQIQAALGITHGVAFDLQAVCSGIRLRPRDGGEIPAFGLAQARARDRGRNLLPHH